MNITENIKSIRRQKGIKSIFIAGKMAISPSTYFALENRNDAITIRQLTQIAAALDVPLTELLFGNAEPATIPAKPSNHHVLTIQIKILPQ